MQKILFAISFCIIADCVSADTTSSQLWDLDARVTTLEEKSSCSQAVNLPSRPQVNKYGVNLFLYGDFLWWNAHENGLALAIQTSSSVLARSFSVHSRWEPGLRLGIGANLPHDGWDLRLTWLRFNAIGSRRLDGGGLLPSDGSSGDLLISSGPVSRAYGHWHLKLNQFDLEGGRTFLVGNSLSMRPYMGMRTDWIHQRWKTRYHDFIAAPLPNHVNIDNEDFWWGLGLLAGMEMQWNLGAGLSLYSTLIGAIVYGFHDVEILEKDTPAQSNTAANGVFGNIYTSNRTSKPILDIEAGLRYEFSCYDNTFRFGFQAGWEHHIYFSQNPFPVFAGDAAGGVSGVIAPNQGNLCLQGWTFAVRFDF